MVDGARREMSILTQQIAVGLTMYANANRGKSGRKFKVDDFDPLKQAKKKSLPISAAKELFKAFAKK